MIWHGGSLTRSSSMTLPPLESRALHHQHILCLLNLETEHVHVQLELFHGCLSTHVLDSVHLDLGDTTYVEELQVIIE